MSGRGGLNASQIVCPLSYNYISYGIYRLIGRSNITLFTGRCSSSRTCENESL